MLPILTASQIRQLDRLTIESEPIRSIDLMERASEAFCAEFMRHCQPSKKIMVCCGQGNNGGDGLAIARLLSGQGFSVELTLLQLAKKGSDDYELNLKRLIAETNIKCHKYQPDFAVDLSQFDVLIDALWGTGINRPLEGIAADCVNWMNRSNSYIVSVDITSGMPPEGCLPPTMVKADTVITFQLPKYNFLLPEAVAYVPDFKIVDIGLSEEHLHAFDAPDFYLGGTDLAETIRYRSKFDHKGTHGHSLIWAGNHKQPGAAVLASKSALYSGSGLVTLHSVARACELALATSPEIMISEDSANDFICDLPEGCFKAIAVGPGLGKHKSTRLRLREILTTSAPLVIDADALNIIAEECWQSELPANAILTPHVKEFDRLIGQSTENGHQRLKFLRSKAAEWHVIIVLKGAHTAIALPDGSIHFNSSGSPALSTAGSGDVLTGIICGLLAQGYAAKDAAFLGVYLHGAAADLYDSELKADRMTATQIIEFLHRAIGDLIQLKRKKSVWKK